MKEVFNFVVSVVKQKCQSVETHVDEDKNDKENDEDGVRSRVSSVVSQTGNHQDTQSSNDCICDSQRVDSYDDPVERRWEDTFGLCS